MNRGIEVALDEVFTEENGVLVVIALPRHIGNNDIVAERKLSAVSRGTVRNRLSFCNVVAHIDERLLIDTGRLVGADKFLQFIMIERTAVRLNRNGVGGDLRDCAAAPREHHNPRVAGRLVLHPRTDKRRLCP